MRRLLTVAAATVGLCACTGGYDFTKGTEILPPATTVTSSDSSSTRVIRENLTRYATALAGDSTGRDYDNPLPDMPEPTVALKIRNIGHLRDIFNDSNHVHWAEAERIGITPLTDLRSHWNVSRPLVRIRSCADYYVEPLRYSRPYLVPEAAVMLHEIGHRFRDSLRARGGGDYRIKVTSILRTPETVARLQRNNGNAVDSSVHQFGTTIDISYARFAADSDTLPRSAEDLKNLLAEVLAAMRSEGKCWVKFERHQPCFHITVRRQS